MNARPDIAALVRERLDERDRPLRAAVDHAFIGGELMRHLDADVPGRALRPSALGHCSRRLAYALADEPEEPRSEAAMTIMAAVGDAAEIVVVAALADVFADPPEALAGWTLEGARCSGKQVRVKGAIHAESLVVDLSGSTDGLLTGAGRKAVLEVKGVSFGADRQNEIAIAKGADPWHRGHRHYWQNEAYMLGLGVDASYVVTVCRDTGEARGWWRERDRGYEGAVRAHLSRVLSSYDPDDVPRVMPDGEPIAPVVDLHKKTGKPNKGHGALPAECALCPFARRCWGEALAITFDGSKRVLRLRGEESEEAARSGSGEAA